MRIRKHEHACLELTEGGHTLIIDPGKFVGTIGDGLTPESLVGIVITHEHDDHWTPEQLASLRERFPAVPIFGPVGVMEAAEAFEINPVHPGEAHTAGPFELKFFGGRHAVIHETLPVVDNVGVLVNGTFYYGGDSFDGPDSPVDVLAAPAGGPWQKVAETIDYVGRVRPARVLAVHDHMLSDWGHELADKQLRHGAELVGAEYLGSAYGTTVDAGARGRN